MINESSTKYTGIQNTQIIKNVQLQQTRHEVRDRYPRLSHAFQILYAN